VGTGTLTLGDGTKLTTATSSATTLSNALIIGDNTNGQPVVIGGSTNQPNPGSVNLTLAGPVTLNDADLEIDIGNDSEVTFTNNLNGYTSGVCLDFGTPTFADPIVIVQGNITNVSRFDLEDNVSVILDGSSGVSQISGVSDVGTQFLTYLGMGSTSQGTGYSTSGNVTAFISYLNGSGSAANFEGTLGFDTVGGSTVVYNDPIDLTNFPISSSFVGLGSATTAELGSSAVITPPGGVSGTNYPFGGGGGTLTVASPLADVTAGTTLTLAAGNAPLTLVLNGSLTYTGATMVDGGALIFNTTPPTGSFQLSDGDTESGYIGATPLSGYQGSFQSFINRVSLDGVEGVVGFDSIGATQTVSAGTINMASLGSGAYLGTATSAIFDVASITPYSNQYQFAAVKGGFLTIETVLTDIEGPYSVAVGLPTPLESFNGQFESVSSVTLSGVNTYTGTTTLNSGYLYVTNSNSLGAGTNSLVVPGGSITGQWAGTLAASGGPVSLSNPIQIQDLESNGLALNTGSTYTLTLLGNISDVEGEGSLGIFGPVILGGANSYSGGTFVDVSPSTPITVGNDTGFGSGFVNAVGGTFSFTSATPVLNSSDSSLGVSFNGSVATFSGSPVIYNLQLAETTINFNGATALINGFYGDSPGSGNILDLGSGNVLTIDTGYNGENNGGTYHGVIEGPGSLVVTYTGESKGSLDLTGVNTYGGGTTVEDGVAVIASNNSALGTGAVTVTGGAVVTNTGVTVTNPITLNGSVSNEAVIAGFGTFTPTSGSIAISAYDGIDPGRAKIGGGGSNNLSIPIPGALTFGSGTSVTFGQGGAMLFSLTDANGAAGTGYGTVSMPGDTLTISATMANPFYIYLATFDPSTNLSGSALNFSATNAYSWTLVSAGSISGFNANAFSFNLGNFTNSTGIGSFFVSQSGNNLMLNFTPVPEPSTWAMMAGGICALAAAVRRRRTQSASRHS
jgi:autotransporter-associated beta strand protein